MSCHLFEGIAMRDQLPGGCLHHLQTIYTKRNISLQTTKYRVPNRPNSVPANALARPSKGMIMPV